MEDVHACTPGKILLHVCCAPCATVPVENLVNLGFEVVLFFGNSNIHPRKEYARRLFEVERLAGELRLELVEDPYDHDAWLTAISGLENEPERGKRCIACFGFNLSRAHRAMRRLSIPRFTTTLTVSRHKSSRDIFAAGRAFEGFVEMDFKKRDGYARSIELSRSLGLYRQDYCGCEFSKAPTPRRG
ncbi:MAG TPA: epoxyqueuosine reductase QueH [Deltaproteobacteria bacterium]|nr:epoxyqueuosine reductase QueH [Deltaproteobacteria bacterium]